MSSLPRPSTFFRRRREAGLLLFTALILLAAIASLELTQSETISSRIFVLIGAYAAVFFIAHLVLSVAAPRSDQLILPAVALLNGLGVVMIYRLDLGRDTNLASRQIMWTAIGLLLFCLVSWFLRDHRELQNYAYVMGLAGLILTALPIIWPWKPTDSDAHVWIRIWKFSIQPGEFAKILLLLFFAALLLHKRRLFTVAGKSVFGLQFPRLRDLGPLALVWAIVLVLMVLLNDFGPALLLFGTVLGMLYMATGRSSWLLLGLGMAVVGAVGAYQISAKIRERVAIFLDPIGHFDTTGYQPSQSLFGLGFGGLTGRGLGDGYPTLISVVESDFILAAFGEELGLFGLAAILLIYALIISRGFRIAMTATDSFGALVAGGLSLTLAIQIFVVTGGISVLMPMTGLTTPFLSHGGSSLLANYILIALLLRISDASSAPDPAAAALPSTASAPGPRRTGAAS